MKIVYIGNFKKLWDEEYVAQAFEELGHEVLRLYERDLYVKMLKQIDEFQPDFILWAKFNVQLPAQMQSWFKLKKYKTVCWVWDLYWGYVREKYIPTLPMFKADYVFTSDGGHQERWEELGINHKCIRQGIHEPECYAIKDEKQYDVVFVGSYNKYNEERNAILEKLEQDFNFTWFGKNNTDEIRGAKLNRLYGKTKVVVGDSVYSPNYWSNRVVETLGRGGFLIHAYVEGIEKEYPHLVTYERGNYQDLKKKIEYYLKHDSEREEIVQKNLEWVKNNNTMKMRCEELCQSL